MGQHGDGTGTNWPTGLDTASAEINSPSASKTKSRAEVPNDISQAVVAMQNNLRSGIWVYDNAYTSLQAAITAASGKTLILTKSWTLSANTTIGATVSVFPFQSGIINSGGYTLTINGPIVGNPMHQWLSGFSSGTLLLNNYGNKNIIRPIWVGMNGDNSTSGAVNNSAWAVLIASLISANAYPVIEFDPNGIYKWTSTLVIDRPCVIRWNRAILDCSGDAGQSNIAINITAPAVTIYDGPYVHTGNLASNKATNGTGLRITKGDITLYQPNISEFTNGLSIIGDGLSVQDVSIYKPVINNCVTLFGASESNNGSFNNINIYGGYLLNDNLVSYGITNARNVQLDGGGSSETSDNVNFWGTIIQAADINGGVKLELLDVDNCKFDGVYWDNSSIITTGKDIYVDLTCNAITFIGGATLGNQKFFGGCSSLTIIDPIKGILLSGGRRLGDSTGATDEHSGYMQKWILQSDNLGNGVTKNMPDATAGILLIHAGVEGGMLLIKSDGTVTIVSGTTNLVTSDTDNKLCVYKSGTRAVIKNRLGSSVSIRAEYTYF